MNQLGNWVGVVRKPMIMRRVFNTCCNPAQKTDAVASFFVSSPCARAPLWSGSRTREIWR